jgi:NADH-quinone oxidoreductase subunit G
VRPASNRRASGSSDRGRAVPGAGEAVLATWHNLLDVGRMQDGEPHLAGTARPAVARMSAATAAEAGVGDGAKVSVATSRGEIRVPVEITAMPDRVVWLPTNSAGCSVRRDLGAGHGSLVTVFAPGGDPRTPGKRSAE